MIPCTSRNKRQSSSKLSSNIPHFIKTAMFTLARLVAFLLVLSNHANGQTYLATESFDGTTFLPTGWTYSNAYTPFLSSAPTWTRVTIGASPTCATQSGAGMAKFNSFNCSSGAYKGLISPAMDFSTVGTKRISFWMYRDNGYNTSADRIEVLTNTAANTTGATLIGTVNRAIGLAPTVAANGWYNYTFDVTTTSATTYLILRATSAFGNNIFIDNVGVAAPVVGYCTPTGNSGYYISNVTTTGGATNIANATAANAGYGNFTAQSASNSIGTGTGFSVAHSATGGGAGVGVWINWNNDFDFADANEQIGITTGWNYSPYTGTINIPAGTPVGSYRMRIVIDYNATSPISCPVGITGETEDYTFTVAAVTACSGTPSPGNTISSPSFVAAPSGNVNLSLQNATVGTGVTYQWQSSTSQTGTYTNIGGATSSTYTATVSSVTWFRCVVTCAGNSGTSNPVQVTLTACIPTMTYGCTDGDVIARVILNTLDNNSGTGCPSGTLGYSNYTTNAALTTTLQPSTSYNCIVYAGQWAANYAAWIDYNDNLVFETSERIGYTLSTVAGSGAIGVLGSSASFPVTLACTPPAGQHLLRIREVFGQTSGITITPCGNNEGFGYGEIEDYLITIAPAPNCPSPGLMSSITATASSALLTWATNCSSSSNYDFQYGPAGFALGTGTMLSNQAVTISAPNASFNLTGLSGGTTYDVYYRANCGGNGTSAWSLSSAFTTYNTASAASASPTLCANTALTAITHTTTGATGIATATGLPAGVSASWSSNVISISGTPSASGVFNYSIPLTGGLGTVSATGTITVLATPAVSAGANQTVCAGTGVTLSGSGATSYVWNNGITNAAAFTPVATQNYTVTGTNSNGCVNTAQVQVTVNALPTVSAGSNQTVCAGTGVTLSGTGATSYAWNNGVTNATAFTPVATQNYTVTGTDANGCVNTAQVQVTVNALPTVSAGANQTVCAGTGVTLSGTGATSYAWNNGVTNATAFTPVATQNYTVTGTDANGCVNTAQVQVTVNALPTVSAGANQTVCAGTGVTLSGTGATSYVWNNGVTNATAFTPVATQNYTVTGTNAFGCVNTAQVQVTVNALPNVSAGANQTVCAGTSVTLSGTGATSYVWNNGITNAAAFTPVATQNYTVTGTNAFGCVNTAQATITVNALPTVSAGANQTVCAGTSVTLSGAGATSYAWNNGITNAAAFTPVATQNYTVTGTNAFGCVNTAQVQVTVNALPNVNAGINQTVCAGTAVTLVGAGAVSYSWDNSINDGVSFTPTATNNYTVVGTDANGCTNTDQVQVVVNALPIVIAGINQTVCAGTAVTLVGAGAVTYSWDNSINDGVAFTPTNTATYTVTGTDANGCIDTDQLQVVVNALPIVIAGNSQTVCIGTAVTLSGAGAVSYSWDNSVNDGIAFTPSNTATYTVTGTDANGCIDTDQVQVVVNPLPLTSAGNNQTVCSGATVTLTGSGATSYSWNNNISNGVPFTATSTTTYTVTGINGNGCVNTAQMTVIVNTLPAVTAGSNQSVCPGTAVTLNGSGALFYSWNNGISNGLPFTPSATTTYTVTGTASNGCSNTAQVQVTVNALPTISAGSNQVICAGTAVTLSGSGGSSYAWNNDISNGVAFTPTSTATYTVTGTDANGCSNTAQTTVTVNPTPTVNAGADVMSCVGETVVLSGQGANTYTWSNGVQNGQAFVPTATGVYSVSGVDGFGCTGTDQVTVYVNSASSSTVTALACNSYILNGQTYNQSGTYNQTIPNAFGCDSLITLNLTLDTPLSAPIVTVSGGALFTNGQANTSYQWIFCNSGFPISDETDTSYVPNLNGQFAVTASNACGSSTSACVTVNYMGVEEAKAPSLTLYPNPTFDYVYFSGDINEGTDYELTDAQGRIILVGKLLSDKNINLFGMSTGLYWIKFDGYQPLQIVKQ